MLPLAAALLILALPHAANAQTNYTWDPLANQNPTGGADGSGTWDTTTLNWFTTLDGQAWVNPVSPTTSNVNNAIFGDGGASPYTITLGSAIDVGTMTFNSMASGGSYTISTSSTDSLTSYGGITLAAGSGPVTISSTSGTGLIFAAANTWTNNSANLLTVSTNITNSTFGLTVAGSGNTLISGAIVGGTSGGLTMGGTGTLTLSGVNTFTGAIAVNSGTLLINGSGSLGSGSYAGAISIGTGATSITAAPRPKLSATLLPAPAALRAMAH